jgi:hypothetical protein
MKKEEGIQLLNSIIEKTGIGEMKDNIDDFIIDLIDEIGGRSNDQDLGLKLKYRRKVNRGAGISLSYYLNNIDNINSSDISYISSFMDYLEHSVFLRGIYTLSIVTDMNVEYKQLIDGLKQLESRCEMYGVTMNISRTKPVDNETLDDLVKYFEHELEYYPDTGHARSVAWKDIGANHIFWLKFTLDLDEDLFKPVSDPSDELPSNIIDDFKTFANRLRMTSPNKRELVNILKRGNWETLTESSNYGNFIVGEHLNKVIFNMFICDYESPNWKENIEILKSINFPTSIETSKGHHKGLVIQVLLDLDLTSAKKFAEEVKSKFQDDVLIVLAAVNVQMKKQPIGYYFDKSLWEPGRYFDRLVIQNKKGIFIYKD